jgi:hypothetical protein
MIEIAFRRGCSKVVAGPRMTAGEQGKTPRKRADVRRADMAGGVGDVRHRAKSSAGAFSETPGRSIFPAPSLIPNASSFQ